MKSGIETGTCSRGLSFILSINYTVTNDVCKWRVWTAKRFAAMKQHSLEDPASMNVQCQDNSRLFLSDDDAECWCMKLKCPLNKCHIHNFNAFCVKVEQMSIPKGISAK